MDERIRALPYQKLDEIISFLDTITPRDEWDFDNSIDIACLFDDFDFGGAESNEILQIFEKLVERFNKNRLSLDYLGQAVEMSGLSGDQREALLKLIE